MVMTYEEMIQAWKDGAEIIDDDQTYKIVKPKTSSSGYDKKVFIVRRVTINDQFGPIEIDKRVWDGMKLKQNRKESRK